jgi:hypothetical protein
VVDPAEGDLEGFVVRFAAFDDRGHLLVPSTFRLLLRRPAHKHDGNQLART